MHAGHSDLVGLCGCLNLCDGHLSWVSALAVVAGSSGGLFKEPHLGRVSEAHGYLQSGNSYMRRLILQLAVYVTLCTSMAHMGATFLRAMADGPGHMTASFQSHKSTCDGCRSDLGSFASHPRGPYFVDVWKSTPSSPSGKLRHRSTSVL